MKVRIPASFTRKNRRKFRSLVSKCWKYDLDINYADVIHFYLSQHPSVEACSEALVTYLASEKKRMVHDWQYTTLFIEQVDDSLLSELNGYLKKKGYKTSKGLLMRTIITACPDDKGSIKLLATNYKKAE